MQSQGHLLKRHISSPKNSLRPEGTVSIIIIASYLMVHSISGKKAGVPKERNSRRIKTRLELQSPCEPVTPGQPGQTSVQTLASPATGDLVVSFGVQGVIVVRIPLGINNPIQTTCCQVMGL